MPMWVRLRGRANEGAFTNYFSDTYIHFLIKRPIYFHSEILLGEGQTIFTLAEGQTIFTFKLAGARGQTKFSLAEGQTLIFSDTVQTVSYSVVCQNIVRSRVQLQLAMAESNQWHTFPCIII